MTTKPLDSHVSVVICPHREGVLLGRWEVHLSGCPASSTEHACGQCEQAMDNFPSEDCEEGPFGTLTDDLDPRSREDAPAGKVA